MLATSEPYTFRKATEDFTPNVAIFCSNFHPRIIALRQLSCAVASGVSYYYATNLPKYIFNVSNIGFIINHSWKCVEGD